MSLRSTLVALSVLAVGCSSSGGSSAPPGGQGTTGPSQTEEDGAAKNAYGVAYPTTNIGRSARNGTSAGNIMQNFKFRGYRTTPGTTIAPSGQLETISLADFYDPELRNKSAGGNPYRVLHITVASVWCSPCNEETNEIVSLVPDLNEKGVVFFQALADGPSTGIGADPNDLDGWIKKHKVNYQMGLDPALKNFGLFFDAAAVPFNADLDLRSMEILYAGVGAPPDITAHVQKYVTWTEKNPAQGAAQ
jgi:hypothetical protein